MRNREHYVVVPIERVPDLVRGAYERSRPVGMGFLHYQPGTLTDEEMREIISLHEKHSTTIVYMDYIKGRCCKFSIWRDEDPTVGLVDSRWYDHTHNDLVHLLSSIGMHDAEERIKAAQEAQEKTREDTQ